MHRRSNDELLQHVSKLYKPHPWHGVSLYTEKAPLEVHAFIEIVPTDTVKYEMDKKTGYLKVDRPQKYSNAFPCLYGFLPQTLSDEQAAAYTRQKLGRPHLVGDKDPLDICVLTEATITHGDIILSAIPIGGLRMIDHDEVDDKIVAVLKDDPIFGSMRDISECPADIINRLKHYFLTYKEIPGTSNKAKCEITDIYGCEEAQRIITLCHQDYRAAFNFELGTADREQQ